MADILFLRGAPAVSSFRLQSLQQAVAIAVPGARIAAADYWHFAACRRPLSDIERRQLAALLEERREDETEGGELFLVTPRIGTISPWSSKATDIAGHCGLRAIIRIERGIAYRLHAPRRHLSATEQSRVAALLDSTADDA